jgi:preprotein translocase subunit SecG
MIILLTIVHILVCFFLVVVVLLQSGKAADLAGAFGGMGSQTAFGPRGSATVLSKATTVAAVLFMLTSMTLAILATRGGAGSTRTVLESHKPAQTQQAPATPGAPAAPAQQAPTPVDVQQIPPSGQGPGAPKPAPAEKQP